MIIKYKENFLKKSRGMEHVIRYIQNPRIKDQSVAAHSYYVALFAGYLCDLFEVDSNFKSMAIEWSLYHDIGESISLDIPANVKRKNKVESKKIEDAAFAEMVSIEGIQFDDIKMLVKLADLLDVLFYCSEEISMGNSFFISIMAEAVTAVDLVARDLEELFDEADVQVKVAKIVGELLHVQERAEYDMDSMTHIHKKL